MSDSDVNIELGVKSRKRKKKQSIEDRKYNKTLRYSGEEHSSTDGQVIKPKKSLQIVLNCCKKSCGNNVSFNDQVTLFNQFYKSASKVLQDQLLAGFLQAQSASTHLVGASKFRDVIWKYTIKVHGTQTSVCRQFILNLFQITEKRLRGIQTKVHSGDTFTEKRGSHSNRPNKINEEVWELAKTHLTLIPSRASHYSRNKSKKRYFENPNLNTKQLYDAFLSYYREQTGRPLKLHYKTYHSFFLNKMNYAFIVPRTDMCDYCSECCVKLKSNPNDECKMKYEVHCRRYRAFKNIKNDLISRSKENDSKILVLEFDYAQNLPLPKTNETAQFYKRLMWLYVFNIHCHNDSSSALYYYLETESKKNPETVCSFLYDFIKYKFELKQYDEVYLLSDSTSGQNRNKMMATFCSWLAMDQEITITHIFPVVGHSFGQCDRNFGVYGNKLKKEEKIHNVNKYLDILAASRTNPSPFLLKNGTNSLKNWSKEFENVLKYNIKSNKTAFKIMSYCRIRYPPTGGILAASAYFGGFQPFSYFKKRDILPNLYERLLPPPRVKMNPAKEKDVRNLFKFLSVEDRQWYEECFRASHQGEIILTEEEETDAILTVQE